MEHKPLVAIQTPVCAGPGEMPDQLITFLNIHIN